ncbi:MAG: hypothetical protein Q9214_002170 [Letrouitia sp. 1 TL-2023]
MSGNLVQPSAYVALRLPSESLSVVEIKPNTTISIGKYGNFPANDLLGRPYYYTYEILDEVDDQSQSVLRIVPASELYAGLEDEDTSNYSEPDDARLPDLRDTVQYEVVGQDGEVLVQTNRNIIDDTRSQTLTMGEIEALKAEGKGSGRDLISKMLESHSAIDQKTAFALAKYTLRKVRKYARRFTALPLDVPLLTRWMLLEKDPFKIMEINAETLALISSWSNVHFTPSNQVCRTCNINAHAGIGKWLVVDETGGLIIAATAEKMGILYPNKDKSSDLQKSPLFQNERNNQQNVHNENELRFQQDDTCSKCSRGYTLPHDNTVTLVHANSQPNLSLLRYFNFDSTNPATSHPLTRRLKTLSWLQLLSPEDDNTCNEPEVVSNETLQSWKSGRRASYYRKRRRWERTRSTVDDAQEGGFDGLIVASYMSPTTILHYLVPLLRGSAQVVIYSPTIEPLTELVDYYSTARRTAFMANPPELETMPREDFPVNPTLLLAPAIQTVRCRPWQVLPGRTHPLMNGRGGAGGYIFHAIRVLPAEGKVEARGKPKRRKKDAANITKESSQKQENGLIKTNKSV